MITNGQFKPTQLSHFEVLLRSACQIHWNANINDLYLFICVTHPSLLITRVHLKCLFLFISLIHIHVIPVIHFFLFVLHSSLSPLFLPRELHFYFSLIRLHSSQHLTIANFIAF